MKLKYCRKNSLCIILSALIICHCTEFTMADSAPLEPKTTNVPQAEGTVDGINGTELLDGLYYTGNKTYYYVLGSMQTGWQEIYGQKYYFSEKNGKMQTNCIAGTKNTGFYYVDATGIQVQYFLYL